MDVVIGSDHAGYKLKSEIIKYFTSQNININFIDVGTYSENSVDYPDIAHKAIGLINEGKCKNGVLICKSGVGMSIVANRYKNIRCALCWNEEIAKLSRMHNDANVIALPAHFIDIETAIKCINAFLNTPFEGGRHLRRISKIEIV